jgi:hypothetical protein
VLAIYRGESLVSIQMLDGVGAGIFGALFFVVVADLTRGRVTITSPLVRVAPVGVSVRR